MCAYLCPYGHISDCLCVCPAHVCVCVCVCEQGPLQMSWFPAVSSEGLSENVEAGCQNAKGVSGAVG